MTDRLPNAVLPPDVLRTLSGMEFLSGIVAGRYPGPPMADLIGGQLVEVAVGRVVFEAMAEARHANPMGTTHGGWFGALLDSAMGCAVMTHLPAGTAYTTLEYKVNLIRAVPAGTSVRAVGETEHAGRSTAVARGRIEGMDGKVIATASTTCLVLRA